MNFQDLKNNTLVGLALVGTSFGLGGCAPERKLTQDEFGCKAYEGLDWQDVDCRMQKLATPEGQKNESLKIAVVGMLSAGVETALVTLEKGQKDPTAYFDVNRSNIILVRRLLVQAQMAGLETEYPDDLKKRVEDFRKAADAFSQSKINVGTR
jgi:hypothetical protein